MTDTVADVLARVAEANQQLAPLLVELLNHPDPATQAEQLHELGRHLGTLSAECLARAAVIDGRWLDPPNRVVIDARE